MFVLDKYNQKSAQENVLLKYICTQEKGDDGVRTEGSIGKHANSASKEVNHCVYFLTMLERMIMEPSPNMEIML